jgi:hypothetical protein
MRKTALSIAVIAIAAFGLGSALTVSTTALASQAASHTVLASTVGTGNWWAEPAPCKGPKCTPHK